MKELQLRRFKVIERQCESTKTHQQSKNVKEYNVQFCNAKKGRVAGSHVDHIYEGRASHTVTHKTGLLLVGHRAMEGAEKLQQRLQWLRGGILKYTQTAGRGARKGMTGNRDGCLRRLCNR